MALDMNPLPTLRGPNNLVAWRIDKQAYASTWDSGIGARTAGGRWNAKGHVAVYCSLDPAAAIAEVAVHKGFDVLDSQPHVLTSCLVHAGAKVHIVDPGLLPNPNWLSAARPSSAQQQYGSALLAHYDFVLFPSVVSRYGWNLVFSPAVASGQYTLLGQERFALDTRLNPPP